MKAKFTLFVFLLLSLICLKSFSQVTYPCGTYYKELNGTTDYGAWSKVYPMGEYTLAAWVQTRDAVWEGKEMDIFQRQVRGFGDDDGLDLYIATNGQFKYRAYTYKNGVPTLDSLSSGVKPDPFKWYHVAVTFQSGGQCNIYINGNLAASKSFGGAMSLNLPYLNYLAIGCKHSFLGGNDTQLPTFKGYLDELAVAEKALTQDQIRTLANGLPAGSPFFVANSVDSYDKEDTYPGTTNLCIGGGSVAIVGTLHHCPAFYTISGKISYIADGSLLPEKKPFEGVTVKASGTTSSSVTNIAGFYFLAVPSGYTGTIIPSVELNASTPPENDPRFIPSSKTFSNVTYDQTQDFTFDPTLAVPQFITSPLGSPVWNADVIPSPIVQSNYQILPKVCQGFPDGGLYTWSFWQRGECSKDPDPTKQHGECTGVAKGYGCAERADDRFAWDCNMNHPQMDLDKGQIVYAVADGEISDAVNFKGWNLDGNASVNQILIKHTNGKLTWYSGYLHMSDDELILRKVGTKIKAGDKIGKVDAKGTYNPNKPLVKSDPDPNKINYPVYHLHFSVYYSDPVILTKLRSVNRQFLPRLIPSTEFDFHLKGSIVSGVKVMAKRDSIWNEYGITHENGQLAVLFMPAVKKGDSIKIVASGYEEMTLAVDSSANLRNNFIVPLIPTSTPSLRIKYPRVLSLDQKAFYNNPTVHLKITGQNFNRYDVIKETDLGDTLITEMTFADKLNTDSLINIDLTDTGSNTYRFVFKGVDTIEIYKSFHYQPDMSGFYNVTLNVPSVMYESKLYVDGTFIKNLTNGNEVISLLNGEHFLNVKANGFRDTTIKVTTAAAYNLSLVPESYVQPDSIVFNFPAHGKIQYHRNVTALDSAMQTVVSIKQIIDNFSGKGLIPKSRKFEFTHLNNTWSGMRFVTVLDQQERLSNDSIYLLRVYNDSSFTKIPFSVNKVSAKYDSAEQKLSYDFIDFNKGSALKEALVILKKQAPIVKAFSDLAINTDTSFSIPLNQIFADPDSIRNDLTYHLLDTTPIGLHLSLKGDSLLIITEKSYTGNTSITIVAEHDSLLAAKTIRVTIASAGPLPITLLHFSAALVQNQVLLNWQTTQEINTSHFVIERSTNGNDFTPIGQVSASSNSSSPKNYSYIDLKPLPGMNFYRLKMVDAEGKFTYSKIVAIKIDGPNNSFRIFPNPANEVLYVQASGANDFATLQIFDASGRKLKEQKVVLNGITFYPLNIKDLPEGVYNLLMKSNTRNDHQKFVKQ